MELQDRVAVITGASSGIGEATAEELAAAGMRLVLTARRAERLAALAGRLPVEVAILPAEIDAPATAQALLDLATERFGRADVIINNAGMLLTDPVDRIDLDEVSRLIRVNFEAVVRCSYVFGRKFKEQGGGAIINVSSIGAHVEPPVWGVYSGLKKAAEGFTRALRQELRADGVKVGLISPGTVDTEIFDGIRPDDGWKETALQPRDVARAIRFMLEQPDRANIVDLLLFAQGDRA